MSTERETLCPSAQHDWEGVRLFAVVGGTLDRPDAVYLEQTRSVTAELLELAGRVAPEEIFRFAAPCTNSGCRHFDSDRKACRLAEKTVRHTLVSVHKLARCAIRETCRWWQQEGYMACQRCPQVVAGSYQPSPELQRTTDPTRALGLEPPEITG